MAITGTVIGTVTVGTPSDKEVNVAIDPITETLTQHYKGRMVIAAGSSWNILPQGNITLISLFWIKVVKSSDETVAENAQGVRLKQIDNTLTVLSDVHALLHICNPKADLDLEQVEVQANADEAIIVEFVVAGS